MAANDSSRPRGRWTEVQTLGNRNVGQAWLYVVHDARGEHEGQYVYKVLKNVTQAARRDRFAIEIEVTNLLASSGLSVVRVIDSSIAEGERPFMVTPYFPRGDLRAYAATGAFTNNLPLTLAFLEQLTWLVKKVHDTTTHRDLKPENILIDSSGKPVLCDFGLCLLLWDSEDEERNSATLEQVGSRHYMAPEALGGFRSVKNPLALDVYSVGKIAYELASGRVLPGIELPIGEYDLAVGHEKADDWYLFSSAVRGLVDHDPSVRMNTWAKLDKVIVQARAVGNESNETDPDKFKIQIARALDGSTEAQEAKRVRDFHAKRDTYREKIMSAVDAAISADPRIQNLIALASESDRLEVQMGRRSSDLITRLPSYPQSRPNETREGAPLPGASVRLRIGKTPADDPMPTLDTDVVWSGDLQSLKLTFAVYQAEYNPGPTGGVIAALNPTPELVQLDWASLGDETYVVEAKLLAAKMATKFADLVAKTVA